MDDAEKLAKSLNNQFPSHNFSWKILGAVLKKTGRLSEAVFAEKNAVEITPDDTETHNNLGNTFKQQGKLEEAEVSYIQAIVLKPDFADAHSNLGNTLKELTRLDEAEASFKQAIVLKPNFANSHSNLGTTLQELVRLEEAEASYMKAIALEPDFSLAHHNLGNMLKEQGKLEKAEVSYKQSIALKPHYAQAHSNLGNTLRELGRLDAAEASYTQAIALKPDFAEAYSNLGNTLKELGRLDAAFSAYITAINLNRDFADVYVNLSLAMRNVKFNSPNLKLYSPLIQMLTAGNFARPKDIARSILSLLKHDPLIKGFLPEKNIIMSLKEATCTIEALNKIRLLHHLLRLCPLPDLQFEGLFVALRTFLLTNLNKLEVSSDLIYFLSSLSIHCFTNEYVYIENDKETQLVDQLEVEIARTIAQSEQPETIKILCLATYRPLHQFDWCQKLEALNHLEEVKARLIEEPFAEKVIAQDIPVLEEISDDVSRKVRAQYEENPYPRWVKLAVPMEAESISKVCEQLDLSLYSECIKNTTDPAILIAGCGTGQHSIETASRFSRCHVTAVDLSLASLAYAQRKSNEIGFHNIDYLQADILHLHKLGKTFDIIESAGVLHHMDEPMAGWRVLMDLLKPSGLMRIGLYSELARHHIAEVRQDIKIGKQGVSVAEIRGFRQSLAASHDENHRLLTRSSDFYSLSTLRDLIFHVQEHRFTLPKIQNCLSELGLKFCGFEDGDLISRFKEFHGEGSAVSDLALWHQFEESNPYAFARMYQFWCQKP